MQTYIDTSRAQRMIDFIQTLRIPEGMHQGQPFRLRDWQKPIIKDVYGPVNESGIRVVRKAIYSVAKKQGKTPIISAIALGHLIGPEAKRNEQIYSAAYERDQAALTFRYMRQMIEMDEELSDLLNIRMATKEIESKTNGSLYKALSSESRSKHGISPAVLIFDELAQFGADREFYDTLIQGRGAHEEPLLWIISTQAADDLAVLSQEIDYALGAGKEDPAVKLFFFTTPDDYEIMDREGWKLSNPALGDFLSETDMIEAANTAQNMPSSEPGFRNLRLNQRISVNSHFMSPGVWKKNSAIPDPDALSKGRITAGLDLSGKNDLSALVLDACHERYHNLFAYFWKPADLIQEHKKKDRVPYDTWIDQGYIEACPGKVIDYEYIAQKVHELHALYHISELRFDRWRIDDFQKALDKIGCESHIKDKEESQSESSLCLVPHGQGYKDINPAIEAVEDIFTDSRARHGGNPVLTSCVSNTVVAHDPAGNRKFEKMKSTGRIDGTVAMAMAMNGADLPEIEDNIQPAVIFFD
jgi:phage terminase large subunit-like protein